MRATSLGIVAFAALVGCASEGDRDDKDAEIDGAKDDGQETGGGDDPTPPVEPGLTLLVVGGDGDAAGSQFPFGSKSATFIRLLGTATAADVVDAIFVFRVLDLDGNLMSSDLEACRRFQVNQFGRIIGVVEGRDASGAPCQHAEGTSDSLLPTVQLIPFDDAPVIDGLMNYVVEIAPEGRFDGPYVLSDTFDVIAADPPECDDDPECPKLPDCPN